MKRILSERNVAAVLFVLVMIAFSLAHEDSKKRSTLYNTSTQQIPKNNSSASIVPQQTVEKTSQESVR